MNCTTIAAEIAADVTVKSFADRCGKFTVFVFCIGSILGPILACAFAAENHKQVQQWKEELFNDLCKERYVPYVCIMLLLIPATIFLGGAAFAFVITGFMFAAPFVVGAAATCGVYYGIIWLITPPQSMSEIRAICARLDHRDTVAAKIDAEINVEVAARNAKAKLEADLAWLLKLSTQPAVSHDQISADDVTETK